LIILTGVVSDSKSATIGPNSRLNPKLIGNLARVGENLQSVLGNVASEITGTGAPSQPTAAHSMVIGALEMRSSSEALARRIWFSLVSQHHSALYQRDIAEVLGVKRIQEAEDIFHVLDHDRNGDVSLNEMIMTVGEISRERKAIARSMYDVGQAVVVLDRFLSVVVLLVLGGIYGTSIATVVSVHL
jgi:hypothetical protein